MPEKSTLRELTSKAELLMPRQTSAFLHREVMSWETLFKNSTNQIILAHGTDPDLKISRFA